MEVFGRKEPAAREREWAEEHAMITYIKALTQSLTSIKDLRDVDGRSITEPDSIKLDIRHAMPDETLGSYVQIIPGGDFLMSTLSIKRTVKVARVSAGGSVLWSLGLMMMRSSSLRSCEA